MQNKRFTSFLMVLFITSILSGCASVGEQSAPSYEVIFDEPKRIRFSGKGAGAGMMLSSTMGPMGVAIGFAIDEGIAKDIHKSFEAKGHSLDALAKDALKEAVTDLDKPFDAAMQGPGIIVLHIQRMGVKMSGGETVVADIQGEVTVGSEVSPLEVTDDDAVDRPIVTLDQLKSDGDATYALLKGALVEAIRRSVQD